MASLPRLGVAAAFAGTFGLVAAACGGAATGTVQGALKMVGGLGPDAGVRGTVRFQDRQGDVVTAQSRADGRFRVGLPPGSYTVTGRSSLVDSGRINCTASSPVVVPANRSTGVTVICLIR